MRATLMVGPVGIERGEWWGTTALLPQDALVFDDDAAAANTVIDALGLREGPMNADVERPVVGLAGGDLCATLGGRGDVAARRGSETDLLPCDLGMATVANDRHYFVAHCLLVPTSRRGPSRLRWLQGPLVAAMNAAWLGDWNLAPKAHPGDGRLDVFQVADEMSMGQRFHAHRRLGHGGHVPHPAIAQRRSRPNAPVEVVLSRPCRLVVDGDDRGPVHAVAFETVDAAFWAAV